MTYLSALSAELAQITRLLEDAGPDALTSRVPACQGWTVRDVVAHLGGVHRMVVHAVRDGERSTGDDHLPGDDVDLAAWFRAGGEDLLRVLDTDPATPAWTFVRESRHVGFWQRRQLMENVVHRVDVEQALGVPSSIDTDVAADGVSEVVDVMIPLRARVLELDGTVRLTATDTGQSWTVGAAGGEAGAGSAGAAGAGDPAGAAAGTAEQLFLVLWKRLPVETLELQGRAAPLLGLPLTP